MVEAFKKSHTCASQAFKSQEMNNFSVAMQSRVLIPARMSTLHPHTMVPATWPARELRVAWREWITFERVRETSGANPDPHSPRPPFSLPSQWF